MGSDVSHFYVSFNCAMAKSRDKCPQKSQFWKRKVSRSRGVEPRSFRLPAAERLKPPGQAGSKLPTFWDFGPRVDHDIGTGR